MTLETNLREERPRKIVNLFLRNHDKTMTWKTKMKYKPVIQQNETDMYLHVILWTLAVNKFIYI